MIRYAVIYENGWYYNGHALTPEQFLFNELPNLSNCVEVEVTSCWTPWKSQWGMKAILKRSKLNIIEVEDNP